MVAGAQANHIHRDQLRSCGLTDHAIAHRIEKGLLERRHPRVYRVGPLTAPRGEEWAAVLWAGGDAHVSHASAAHLYDTTTRPQLVHITITTHNPGRTPGVMVHRRARLPEKARRRQEGLPLTSPLRTLVDCAAEMGEPALERLVAEFQIKPLVTDAELRRAADTSRPGMPTLRAILRDVEGFTRNEAERLLRRLIADAGLPRPRLNARIGDHEFDVYWPEHGLVLEFHGYGPHRTRKKFESDAIRTAFLAGRNLRLITATWRRLKEEPLALTADIATALAIHQPA